MAKKRKRDDWSGLDPKVHRRLLGFLNGAGRAEDLTVRPTNEVEGVIDPEHRRDRPFRHELTVEERRQRREQILDPEVAGAILELRERHHPRGFAAIDDLDEILDDHLRGVFDRWLEWFGPRTYGSWSAPIDLKDGDGHFSVVHAAVLKTGQVIMIEHACHSGISKTPIWDPPSRSLAAAPTPPTEGLYCSGHCFLSDGTLLVVGGRGDANHWPNDKDIAWLYDPDTNTWDVTRDRTSVASPKPRTGRVLVMV